MAKNTKGSPTLVLVSGGVADKKTGKDPKSDSPFAEAHEKARERLAEELEQGEQHPRRSYLMSLMLLRRGHIDDSVRMLEKLALTHPDDPAIVRSLSLALKKSGDDALSDEMGKYADELEKSGKKSVVSGGPGQPTPPPIVGGSVKTVKMSPDLDAMADVWVKEQKRLRGRKKHKRLEGRKEKPKAAPTPEDMDFVPSSVTLAPSAGFKLAEAEKARQTAQDAEFISHHDGDGVVPPQKPKYPVNEDPTTRVPETLAAEATKEDRPSSKSKTGPDKKPQPARTMVGRLVVGKQPSIKTKGIGGAVKGVLATVVGRFIKPEEIIAQAQNKPELTDEEAAAMSKQPFELQTQYGGDVDIDPAKLYASDQAKKEMGGAPKKPFPIPWDGRTKAILLAAIFIPTVIIAFVMRGNIGANQVERDRVGVLLQRGDLAGLIRALPANGDDISGDSGAHLRADAVLYRFFDASPARRTRVLSAIAASGKSHLSRDDRTVANALLMSKSGRLPFLADLIDIEPTPLVLWLRGTTEHRAGLDERAEETFDKLLAADNTPAYLLAAAALYFERTSQPERARRVVKQLSAVAPDSIPTGYADDVRMLRSGKAANQDELTVFKKVPRAMQAELAYELGAQSFRRRKTDEGKERLTLAAKTTQGSPAQIIDFVDALLTNKRVVAARHLIENKAWPKKRPASLALEGYTLFLEGKLEEARVTLNEAWEAGSRDPRNAAIMVAVSTGKEELSVRELFAEHQALWPEQHAIAMLFSEWLIADKDYQRATEIMGEQIHYFRRRGTDAQRAHAYYVYAEAESGRGNRVEALRMVKRALKWEPDHTRAKQLKNKLARKK